MAKSAPAPAARKPPVSNRVVSRNVRPSASTPPARTPPAAASTAGGSASTEPAKRERKPRTPPMVRAVKFCHLADANCRRGIRLVGNWSGDLSPDQKKLNTEILARLKEAALPLESALLAVGLLEKSGFVPKEARGRAITEPFTAGERVAVKQDFYREELHGKTNDFEVVVQVGGFVKIRPTGDLRATQLVVTRSHLQLLDTDDADDAPEESEEETGEESPEGEAPEGEESESASGDPKELDFDQR